MDSYLRGRSQSVTIDGKTSDAVSLKYGVPQGSVLGPILFTIYTIPIGHIARKYDLELHLYADDTQLYVSFRIKSPTTQCEVLSTLQACVAELRVWMAANKLCLNDAKTEFLTLCAPWQRSSVEVSSLGMGLLQVNAVPAARNLGVIMDSTLNMEAHIQHFCQTSVAQLKNIADIRRFITQDSAEMLVLAFITSRLDYCNALLYGLPATSLQKLQRVQNRAGRVLTGTHRHEHVTPMLHQPHWLPVQYRVLYKIALLTYKALHGEAPGYLSDLIVAPRSVRSLRLTTHNVLASPRTKLKTYGDRAFSAAAPAVWNSLPPELRAATSCSSFKTQLKTHLFNLAF